MILGRRYQLPLFFLAIFGILLLLNSYLGTPRPWITDEYSYLLAADTFLDGRLTNPPHALPQFFENAHIIVTPTYMSKYPPGQAILLALGKLVFNQYFYGVLLGLAFFTASFYWLLRAIVHNKIALLSSLIITLVFALNSSWGRSYVPGGLPAAGACLALGAYIYSLRKKHLSKPWQFAAGLIILSMTRPYEGAVLITALAAFYAYDIFKKNINTKHWHKFTVITSAGLLVSIVLNAVYNQQVTGDVLLLPNQLHIRQYMYTPYFWLLKLRTPEFVPAADIVHQLYFTWERQTYDYIHSMNLLTKLFYLLYRLVVASFVIIFFLLSVIIEPAIGYLDQSAKRLQYLFMLTILSSSLITWVVSYYIFASIISGGVLSLYIFSETLNDKHHLIIHQKIFKIIYQILCVCLTVYIFLFALQNAINKTGDNYAPAIAKNYTRENIIAKAGTGSRQNMVFVHYGNHHSETEELIYKQAILYHLVLGYVYNGPDIDRQNIVFAHDLGHAENKKLLNYYKSIGQERKTWLLNLDGIKMNGKNLEFGAPALSPYR